MKNKRQQTFSYSLVARFWITPFLFFVRILPLWLARLLAWVVTPIYYPFFTVRRRNYQANLKHILGNDVTGLRLFATSFRMLVNYAYYMNDLFRMNEDIARDLGALLTSASGHDTIKEVLEKGKGAILLTAHMGNWELGGIVLSRLGYPVNVVYFPDGSGRLDRSRTRQRMAMGVKEIRLDPDNISPLAMMRALQNGELVAIQGDKLYHDSGVKADFFDAPAYFPRGPVLLSMLTGAPILPSFIVMDKDTGYSKYKIIVDEPIYTVKTGDRERDVEENVQRMATVLEKYIGQYYEQWYCMTKFWGES